MTDGQEMIRLDGIGKIYNPGDVTEMCLFTDFSLSVAKGEFVSVVGSNGSGKTSLLNIICGSVPVDAGRIVIDGRDVTNVPEHLRYARIGRVWQNPATGTCSDLTILETAAPARASPPQAAKEAQSAAASVSRRGYLPHAWNFTVNALQRSGWGLRTSSVSARALSRAGSGRQWR